MGYSNKKDMGYKCGCGEIAVASAYVYDPSNEGVKPLEICEKHLKNCEEMGIICQKYDGTFV